MMTADAEALAFAQRYHSSRHYTDAGERGAVVEHCLTCRENAEMVEGAFLAGYETAKPAPTPEAVERVARFLDETVRGWLPSDHFHCDSSCPDGASQREVYDLLDAAIAALRREA